MTNLELLQGIAGKDSITEPEEQALQHLLRQCGFPKCKIVYGIVYLEGYGHPFAAQSVAKEILNHSEEE